ncbi:MAG: ISKra4-like element ISDesp4 family transposase, partial [Bryobacteraceae bacterium]
MPLLYIEMDGTGLPVVKAETEGRAGKVEGKLARTREVKPGCLFTQTTMDADGRPVRDEQSTSYAAAIESAESFGLRLYTEAWRRGWSRAAKKAAIADGAIWIWNLAGQRFPGPDRRSLSRPPHLWELSGRLFPGDEKARKRQLARCLDRLEKGKIEALMKILRDLRAPTADPINIVANDADYFERNADRMRYP